MSVQIQPDKFLTFQRPLTRTVEEILTISNPHSTPIAFKVKTTAPKQYCVRPNSGIIDPGSTREVLVMLQAFKEEPESDHRCKDKFLVQTVMVPADKQLLAVNDLWSEVEGSDAASIQQHKLKCEFLPANAPETEAVDEVPTNGSSAASEPTIRQRSSPTSGSSDALLQNDYISTQNEVLQMKEKLQEYEKELTNIRSHKESTPPVAQVQQQGYPIQVLIMVAIAVFAMSYAIFGTKQ